MRDNKILTQAIESTLMNDANVSAAATIERNVRVNNIPERMPWIGVYSGRYTIVPYILGDGLTCKRWKQIARPSIIIQVSNEHGEGEEASDELEDLIDKVLIALSGDNNRALSFDLDRVRLIGIDTEYSYLVTDEYGSGDLYSPQVELSLKLEVG